MLDWCQSTSGAPFSSPVLLLFGSPMRLTASGECVKRQPEELACSSPPSPSVISMTDQRSWLQLCMYVSRVCRVWLGNSCEDVGLVSIDVWGPIPVSGSPPLWVPHAANRAMLFVRLIILMTP